MSPEDRTCKLIEFSDFQLYATRLAVMVFQVEEKLLAAMSNRGRGCLHTCMRFVP